MGKVLIVCDEEYLFRKLPGESPVLPHLVELVRQIGFEAVVAQTGKEAIVAFAKDTFRFVWIEPCVPGGREIAERVGQPRAILVGPGRDYHCGPDDLLAQYGSISRACMRTEFLHMVRRYLQDDSIRLVEKPAER